MTAVRRNILLAAAAVAALGVTPALGAPKAAAGPQAAEAPVAYVLSAVAAVIYCAATFALARVTIVSRRRLARCAAWSK